MTIVKPFQGNFYFDFSESLLCESHKYFCTESEASGSVKIVEIEELN